MVIEAIDSFYKQLGVEGGYLEAAAIVRNEVNTSSGNAPAALNIAVTLAKELFRLSHTDSMEGFAEAITNAGKFPTLELLREKFAKDPDLNEADLHFLDQLRAAPRAFKAGFKDVHRRIVPKGGHPFLVPKSAYPKICQEIIELLRKGDKIGEAKRKVAKMHKCKASTINQIWSKRGQEFK